MGHVAVKSIALLGPKLLCKHHLAQVWGTFEVGKEAAKTRAHTHTLVGREPWSPALPTTMLHRQEETSSCQHGLSNLLETSPFLPLGEAWARRVPPASENARRAPSKRREDWALLLRADRLHALTGVQGRLVELHACRLGFEGRCKHGGLGMSSSTLEMGWRPLRSCR